MSKSSTTHPLGIDIGGSGLKAGRLDPSGRLLGERARTPTPQPARPAAVVEALAALVSPMGGFDRVSVGFPGVVRGGRVLTAPNLGTAEWRGHDLARALAARWGRPVRMLNDATVHGLGVIAGRGVELVVTLGTGFGFALYWDGRVGPQVEVGQHPARKEMTYDQYVGAAALNKVGRKRWRARVRRVLAQMEVLANPDALLVGGGNARLIDWNLPAHVRLIGNESGVTGGARLWDPALDPVFASGAPAGERQGAS